MFRSTLYVLSVTMKRILCQIKKQSRWEELWNNAVPKHDRNFFSLINNDLSPQSKKIDKSCCELFFSHINTFIMF